MTLYPSWIQSEAEHTKSQLCATDGICFSLFHPWKWNTYPCNLKHKRAGVPPFIKTAMKGWMQGLLHRHLYKSKEHQKSSVGIELHVGIIEICFFFLQENKPGHCYSNVKTWGFIVFLICKCRACRSLCARQWWVAKYIHPTCNNWCWPLEGSDKKLQTNRLGRLSWFGLK